MSKIIAVADFTELKWQIDCDNLNSLRCDLYFSFVTKNAVVRFKDLKFGYELKKNDKIEQYNMFPPYNTKYLEMKRDYLVIERLKIQPDTDYKLYLWAEDGGKTLKDSFNFRTLALEKAAQPYNSWIWNSKTGVWVAPEPYPDDGKYYEWNEETQTWVEVTE